MTQRRRLLKALAATPAALLAGPWTAARAQGEYPAKPVKIVVPFAAGSTPDVFARIVSGASPGSTQEAARIWVR